MSDLILRAERFARERHSGQFRKGTAKEQSAPAHPKAANSGSALMGKSP